MGEWEGRPYYKATPEQARKRGDNKRRRRMGRVDTPSARAVLGWVGVVGSNGCRHAQSTRRHTTRNNKGNTKGHRRRETPRSVSYGRATLCMFVYVYMPLTRFSSLFSLFLIISLVFLCPPSPTHTPHLPYHIASPHLTSLASHTSCPHLHHIQPRQHRPDRLAHRSANVQPARSVRMRMAMMIDQLRVPPHHRMHVRVDQVRRAGDAVVCEEDAVAETSSRDHRHSHSSSNGSR